MTEQEMRELDDWIAEHGMGWKPQKMDDSETLVAWSRYDDKLKGWIWTGFWNDSPDACYFSGEQSWKLDDGSVMTASRVQGRAWEPTRKASQLKMVKREIERHGWWWSSSSPSGEYPFYSFYIVNEQHRGISLEKADTEEVAGCLAFKVAMGQRNETLDT